MITGTATSKAHTAAIDRLAVAFAAAGRSLVLVGGYNRNAVMGLDPRDLDFATDALPAETATILAGAADIRADGSPAVYGYGTRHGTVAGRVAGEKVEISTFRGETYGDGHRPEGIRFVETFEEDACRRDFTMNAIGYDCVTGEILDPCGGVADISRGVLRAIGDPDLRFAEDEQRILRAARFVAEYGLEVDSATRDAMGRHAAGLADVAPGRVRDELMGILAAPVPSRGLDLLAGCGALAAVLPEIDRMRGMRQPEMHHDKDVYWHTLRAVDAVRPDPTLRLAALFHDIGKPDTLSVTEGGTIHFYEHERVGEAIAGEVMLRLCVPAGMRKRVGHLVRRHMHAHRLTKMWSVEGTADIVAGTPPDDGGRGMRRLVRKMDLVGTDGQTIVAAEDVMELGRADILAGSPVSAEAALRRWEAIRAAIEDERRRRLEEPPRPSSHGPVPGGEIVAALGLDPRADGPRIGVAMAAIRDAHARGAFEDGDVAAAVAVARAALDLPAS